jgi:hypothetical protein
VAAVAHHQCAHLQSMAAERCVPRCREIANVVLNIAAAAQQSAGGLGRFRGPRRATKAVTGAAQPAPEMRARR